MYWAMVVCDFKIESIMSCMVCGARAVCWSGVARTLRPAYRDSMTSQTKSINLSALGWREKRQISITPRRLYVIILRIFVIQPSTPFNLNDIESGSRRSAFRSQHEGYYPALSGTLPLPQVTMAKNVHRVQKCAMTRCPQIYNPLILKVAKRDL